MLEPPDISAQFITDCFRVDYALSAISIVFLPLGADQNTAVYRVVAHDGMPYFVKLRRGVFDKTSVTLPKFLSDQGIPQIIAPLPTQAGSLWADLVDYTVIVYPFIDGRNGYEVDLSDQHWIDFGAALKHIHTASVPPSITNRILRETYSSHSRDLAKEFLPPFKPKIVDDLVARQALAFLQTKHVEILALIERTERLAQALQAQSLDYAVCHSDLHAGNIFVEANGALYIVDWDAPILAPKERDLMYAGGGQFGLARTPREEEALFYQGYGETSIDATALVYYRYERIIEDIAVECQLIFSSTAGDEDRVRELRFLKSNFESKGVLAIARQADRAR